jgi:hypothetical protein
MMDSMNGCGENLYVFQGSSTQLDPRVPIDAWYSEIGNYDFKHSTSRSGEPVGKGKLSIK